jgi:two-component system copper resistance phosphate regulon response regulator CusR
MRILIIEDDAAIRQVIKRGLEENRYYTVETAADGVTGLDMARNGEYALIILDIMLPGMDGWQVCSELRSRRDQTPILMLTARDDELLARVRALLRRDKIHKARVLRIAHLEIDTGAHRVTCDGEEVTLTPREYALLEALAVNEGRVLSRDVIQYQIWNNDDSFSNTVDVHIGILRKKIDADRPVKLIHTVHGLGYMLKRPAEAPV